MPCYFSPVHFRTNDLKAQEVSTRAQYAPFSFDLAAILHINSRSQPDICDIAALLKANPEGYLNSNTLGMR